MSKGLDKTEDAELAGGLLLLAARTLLMRVTASSGEVGLRPLQAAFLINLLKAGDVSMGEIAKLSGTTRGVVTRFVERLVKKGLVERHGDEKDRRVVHVTLTGKGEEVAGRMLDTYNRWSETAMAGVSDRDRRAFLKVLARIRDGLEEARSPYAGDRNGSEGAIIDG
jgi:DNA-binding MarR family transcriptional regulator